MGPQFWLEHVRPEWPQRIVSGCGLVFSTSGDEKEMINLCNDMIVLMLEAILSIDALAQKNNLVSYYICISTSNVRNPL